ncbi:leucine-rich repeat-containing protein 18 [Halichoeres trimaculatus]|uniref:leucine-rich repeat-containing protein 18 n=1 Tax=Halichoeres trimaculatus TaxID=147232 RepID=UPI003D9F25CF
MPKGKGAKGTKVTLKVAKRAVRITPDGRRRLILSKMGIITFPKCLLKLTNVDELDLSRNMIQKLPEDIGRLSWLRWLDLHSNKLESLPESMGNLVGLTHLNLSNNCLTSAGLPASLGALTGLTSLNLGLNQLDALPATMTRLDNLQELGLFDNCFTKLPECVRELRTHSKVNTRRNPLGDGEETPGVKPEPGERTFLVHESSLCRKCFKRCKEQNGGGGGGGGGDADMCEEKRIRTYKGLMVPNSVAAVDQDVWRIRKSVQ